MKEIKKEDYINQVPKPVSLKGTEKIINQMKYSICKIHDKEKIIGIGFFCKIKYKLQLLPFLIINNHILNENNIKDNKYITISIMNNINYEEKFINIKLNKKRIIYTNKELDITLIEIKQNIDKINIKYLELDDNINKDNLNNICLKKSIYLLYYNKNNEIVVSYGIISKIYNNEIYYLCNIDSDSSGSPILSLDNYKLIGIHKGNNINKGIFIKYEINIKNEMKIIYSNQFNEEYIQIFGDKFVKNNKEKCKIIIDNKEKEICSMIYSKDKNIIEIKIIEIKNITNMSYMFDECSSLISLPDISKWNTSNVTDMSYMFYECSYLSSLPDISQWNTSNITNISYMFADCSLLSSLPDISKWNTSKVTNMSGMFDECSSLISLPDISKWNTSNVINMNYMFADCSKLSSLPDISKWNTSKVINMSGMFDVCSSLLYLPDISKWNTSNVINMSWMFSNCSSLSS